MNIKRIASLLICAAMLVSVVAACDGGIGGGSRVASQDGPFGAYNSPITMSIGRGNVNDPAFDAGQDMENNLYIDLIKESLNIEIEYAWLIGDDYGTRINLVIASGDMPDVMFVTNRQQLTQLAEADMLLDLQEAYNDYSSALTRGFYDSFAKPPRCLDGLEAARYDGKLIGMPNTNIGYQYSITWIRQDWMNEVGETPPETLDDIIRIARTFIDRDPGGNGPGNTVGIPSAAHVAGWYNSVTILDSVFNLYQSFPRTWVLDESTNKFVYGTIMPETKEALAKLAQMYSDGIIDPQFSTNEENQIVAAGQAGIIFSPWWSPWWPLASTVELGNPDAVWMPYIAPLASDGSYYQPYPNPQSNWIVANKDYDYPDAVIKMVNLTNFMLGQDAEADELIPNTTSEHGDVYAQLNRSWTMWPFPLQMIWNDNMLRLGADLKRNIADGNNFADNPSFDMYIQGYNGFLTNPGADVDQTVMYMNTLSVLLQLEKDHLLKYPTLGFPGTTETMATRWANLETLEDQMLLQIIMGHEPVDFFDTFVQQWLDQGGAIITEEVNAQLN